MGNDIGEAQNMCIWAMDFSSSLSYFGARYFLSGECMLLGSVSSQQRFGVTDIKALHVSQLSGLGQTVL